MKQNSIPSAGAAANSSTNVQVTTSSHNSSKPHVGGSLGIRECQINKLNSIMSKFGEAHNMLARTSLSKKEYQPISSLLATAKVELFNFYLEIKETI